MYYTLSDREVDLWRRYRYKWGPFNPVRLYDTGPALISSMISRVNGGKASAKDFIAYGNIEKDIEISGDEFVDVLKKSGTVKIRR